MRWFNFMLRAVCNVSATRRAIHGRQRPPNIIGRSVAVSPAQAINGQLPMPVPVKIPKCGMTMTEATVVRWLVAVGDRVKNKQPLVEIETEKIVSEIESPVDGTLAGCSAAEGKVAPVAQTIAWILTDGESVADIPSGPGQIEPACTASVSAKEIAVPAARREQPSSNVRTASSSPAVRRLAREYGVELNTIVGSGPDGRVLKEDILRSVQQKPLPCVLNKDGSFEPLSAARRAIVATVMKSAAIPQIVLYASADISALVALHDQDKSIAYDDMFIYFVAKTLQHDKHLNASYEEEGIRVHAQVNIGVMAAAKQRLLIPVIRDADRLSLGQISTERKRLMDLVRSRKITEQDTLGGTFTITNLSMYPVDSFTALLNPPQAAILSVGRVQQIAAPAADGSVVFRPRMTFGLTLDHRVVDGTAGAVFLRHFIARIERPNMEEA